MENDGIAADKEVLNAMGIERGQKIFEVLEHPA